MVRWHDIKNGEPGNYGSFLINDPNDGVCEGFRFDSGRWGKATFNGQVMDAFPTHWAEMPEGPGLSKAQSPENT